MRTSAIPLLAASLTRNPITVGAVALATWLPWIFFALPSGVVADRVSRKRILIVADSGRTVIVLLLAVLVTLGTIDPVLLCAIAFLLGIGEVFFETASQSIVPMVVDPAALEKANSRLFSAQLIMRDFAGLALGGVLFALGHSLPFYIDAASFALGLGFVIPVRLRSIDSQVGARAGESILESLKGGIRWLNERPILWRLASVSALLNVALAATNAVLVLYALSRLRVSPAWYGVLLAGYSLGGLVGSSVATRLRRLTGTTGCLIISLVSMGGSYIVVAETRDPYLAVVMFAVSGFALLLWNVLTVSLRQRITPADRLGRVNSVYRLLSWGGLSVGAPIGGWLAAEYGLPSPFLAGGALLVLLAPVVALTCGASALRDLGES
jgi:MFS family permease